MPAHSFPSHWEVISSTKGNTCATETCWWQQWLSSVLPIHPLGAGNPFWAALISLNVDGKEKLCGMEHMRNLVSSGELKLWNGELQSWQSWNPGNDGGLLSSWCSPKGAFKDSGICFQLELRTHPVTLNRHFPDPEKPYQKKKKKRIWLIRHLIWQLFVPLPPGDFSFFFTEANNHEWNHSQDVQV